MPSTVHVGTILMKEWPGMPPLDGLETGPGLGELNMVKVPDGFTLDRKIHAAGWNLFFMAAEVKAMFFGPPRAAKIQSALKRILGKVEPEHFNGLEVSAIVARHFLGVPYVTVSAHSRHMQHSCNLDSAETRQSFQHDSDWARGRIQVPLRENRPMNHDENVSLERALESVIRVSWMEPKYADPRRATTEIQTVAKETAE
jgi:hypothetical protein